MPVIAVDPTDYAAASTLFGSGLAGGVTTTYRTLMHALASTDAMAGQGSGGESWGQNYDTAAQVVCEGIAAFQRACVALGSMLQRTGFNHSLAESHSDPARCVDVLDTTDYTAAPELYWLCGDFPMAAGGSGEYPAGWDLVRDIVGFEWPDGRPDRLRAAAAAWHAAGESLLELTGVVDDAVGSIAEQQSPEVLDATIVCTAMATHLTSVAAACSQLGQVCAVYARVVDGVHSQCVDLLDRLLDEIDAAEVSGLIFSGETEGGSGEEALALVTSLITRAAHLVKKNLVDLIAAVAEFVELQDRAGTITSDVTQALQPILTNGTVTADTVIVAGGPMAAAHNAELLAMRRLSVAARINWAGIKAADRMGGHTERRHVGKSDNYLIKRAQESRRSNIMRSTFTTLAAANDATAANIANNTEKIRQWIDSGSARNLTLMSTMDPGQGRIYVKSTGSLVSPTAVVTVLCRGQSGYFVLTSFPEVA